MLRDSGKRSSRYIIFMLSLWEEAGSFPGDQATWRFSLEGSQGTERKGFRSLDALTAYLDIWTRHPPEGALISPYQGGSNMERRIVNPWKWQDEYGYVQANEVREAQRTLYCSGQAANDETGAAVLAGDMRGQISLALDNLEALLREAGYSFADIVRLNIYTTDVDQFFAHYDAFIGRLAEAGCRHTGSLIGVTRLAFPEMMIEIEATAVA